MAPNRTEQTSVASPGNGYFIERGSRCVLCETGPRSLRTGGPLRGQLPPD